MVATTDSFLLFSDLPSAQARSQQMANALHCEGVLTRFWYESIQLTNGQGAMVVQSTGSYGTKPGPTALSQLTPSEIAALQSFASVQLLLPVNPH